MAAWVIALLVVWGRALMHLASEWSLNPQFQFGPAVPVLALFLAWFRVRSAASPAPAEMEASSCRMRVWITLALIMFLWAELILSVDTRWRIISGLQVGSATILTAVWLRQAGGLAVLRAMAFPLLFVWVAVPWPTVIEFPVTQGLMLMVTGITVEFLNAVGIAALQHGNVIEMSCGVVGVETACSGVQSFQASLMVSLFLGELWRFGLRRRLALVAASAVIAFAGNLARTIGLAWIVSRDGAAGLERHHDMIGSMASGMTFLMILGLAFMLARRTPVMIREAGRLPVLRPIRGHAGYVVALMVILAPLLVSGWFYIRGKNAHVQNEALWMMRKAGASGGWRVEELRVPEESLRILQCSESRSVTCRSPGGVTFQIHHFFWKPLVEVPSLATAHTPDICMPNAGWTLVRGPVPVTLNVGSKKISGAFFHFTQAGVEVCVFHAIWHGGEPQVLSDAFHSLDRFRDRAEMIWEGKRNRGHEVLTLIVPAMGDRVLEAGECREALECVFGAGK